METAFLGVDIAKLKFDAALMVNGKTKSSEFENTIDGFHKLNSWLEKYDASDVHVCMESTGVYSEGLAKYLFEKGILTSVVNPVQIKRFGGCKLTRTKTDKADAQLIAEFCKMMRPSAWTPKPDHVRDLQQWVHRLESLMSMRQQERNRLGVAASDPIRQSISDMMDFLDDQISDAKNKINEIINGNGKMADKQKLLETIPGIGDATIAQVLAFFGEPNDFQCAKQVSAFLGLNPRQHQSGTSVNKCTRISKVGDSRLRKSLYMPALVAIRHNPVIRKFYDGLVARGKPKKSAVVASMRKLVHIIYGVLKNEQPFDANWQTTTKVV